MKRMILCITCGLLTGFSCVGEQPYPGTNLVDPWNENYQTIPELKNSMSYDESRLMSHPAELLEGRRAALNAELAKINEITTQAAANQGIGSFVSGVDTPLDQNAKLVAATTDTAAEIDMPHIEYFYNLHRENCIIYTSGGGWE